MNNISENMDKPRIGGYSMKKAIITMILMVFVMIWPLGGLWEIILKPIIGGTEQSFIYPLYIGIILLTGIIVGCTDMIIKEIRSQDREK